MDFSKFRASGDLSDIVVVVGDHENKLHKFPLYARSDYFCELERSRAGCENEVVKAQLDNFPGGNETFETVADFCYNMHINIDKTNAVAIRCASEYLKMNGMGNLIDISDKFIQDSIAAAKLNRSSAAMLSMLMDCNQLGEIAKTSGIVDICIEALVDCLSKTMNKYIPISSTTSSFSKVTPKYKTEENTSSNLSAFTKVHGDPSTSTTASNNSSPEMLDEVTMTGLVSIQSEWFSLVLQKAKEKGIAVTKLGALAVKYVTSAIEKDSYSVGDDSPEVTASEDDAKQDTEDTEKEKDTTVVSPSSTPKTPVQSEPMNSILDNVILSLPEHAYSIPSVTMEWLTKVLRIASARGCQCRGHLVRVAGEMLTRLGPEDLCIISPSVLHDIVQDANVSQPTESENGIGGDEGTGTKPNNMTTTIHSERACKLVDTYLAQMTSKGVLTAETFCLLASATKDYPRPSHDSLFAVLQFVLESEKDKITPTKREELVSIINFDLVSETNLEKALENFIASPDLVAKSAVKLCAKLRSELDSVKYIAEMQEQDIQKYQAVATSNTARLSPTRESPPLLKDSLHYRSTYRTADRHAPQSDLEAHILESSTKSPHSPGAIPDHHHHHNHNHHHDSDHHNDDHDEAGTTEDYRDKSDALRAAQNVLTAARHKLALPVYTGYRPSHLTRLHSPSNSAHHSAATTRSAMEHDITLEEELEFKFDRSFRSLDPRVRNHHGRMLSLRENPYHSSSSSHHHNAHRNSPRSSYFPYSSSYNRY